MKQSKLDIELKLLEWINHHPQDLVSFAATELKRSKATILRHINSLISQELIKAEGTTHKTYSLGKNRFRFIQLNVRENQDEYMIWERYFAPFVINILPPDLLDIIIYGFTEMVNNIIDHSNATDMLLTFRIQDGQVKIGIYDNGVGIFKKITTACNLPDERLALLELAKGKLTTDKKNHTGEGIFFTSRVFDFFCIESDRLQFTHNKQFDFDLLVDIDNDNFFSSHGTAVLMQIALNQTRTLNSVFEEYTASCNEQEGIPLFNKTVVPMRLARFGNENLISRSQAKRIYARFEVFNHIILDFSDVEIIGQAFADELFRVFTSTHPDINLYVKKYTPAIKLMILRANPDFQGFFDH